MKVVTHILDNEFCLGSLNWVFLVLFVHYLCGKVQNLIENIVTISEEHIAVRRVKLSIGFQVVGHNCQVLLQSGSRPNNHSICEGVRHATEHGHQIKRAFESIGLFRYINVHFIHHCVTYVNLQVVHHAFRKHNFVFAEDVRIEHWAQTYLLL